MQCGQSSDMYNGKKELLRNVLKQSQDAGELFDRLLNEYRASGEADRLDLFLALLSEAAIAQAAARAICRHHQPSPLFPQP